MPRRAHVAGVTATGVVDVYIVTRPSCPPVGARYAPVPPVGTQLGLPMSHCQPVRVSVCATPSIVVGNAPVPYELCAVKSSVISGDQLPITSTTSPSAIGMFVGISEHELPMLHSATAPFTRTRKPAVSPAWYALLGSSSATIEKLVAAVKLKPRVKPL